VIVEHLADGYLRVGRLHDAARTYRDAEARTDNEEQRTRLRRKLADLRKQHGLTATIAVEAAGEPL
jgi:hypothetical protein